MRVSGGGRAAVRNKRTNSSPTHRQWERSRESCRYFTSPTLSRLPYFFPSQRVSTAPHLPSHFLSGPSGSKSFLGGFFFWIEEGEWSCSRAHRHFSEARQVKVRCETRLRLYLILLNSRLHLELILPECENLTSRWERVFLFLPY